MMLATCLLGAGAASAQTLAPVPAMPPAPPIQGTVVSATRTTLVIRTGAEDYRLFVLDSETFRPAQIPAGASVAVASRASDDPSAPFATEVKVTAPPPAQSAQTAAQTQEVVPPSVRRLEQSVQRQTRRFRLGVRTGVTVDQELFSLGTHVQIGPFFRETIWARPNVEFGFGEVTTLVALNFEGVYRVPVTQRDGRWAVFFGGGPSVNFTDQNFAPPGFDDDEDLDEERFDDFNLDAGFNILMGVQSRGGMFLELRSSVYSSPHLRFVVGYNF
jgi:hypothetical protein